MRPLSGQPATRPPRALTPNPRPELIADQADAGLLLAALRAGVEDVFETLTGLEIIDEQDKTADLQRLARQRWRKRARELGVELDEN